MVTLEVKGAGNSDGNCFKNFFCNLFLVGNEEDRWNNLVAADKI